LRIPYKPKVSNPSRPAKGPRTTTERSDQSEAQKHFEAFEEVVTEALKAGEEVQITGFGKFTVKERKAREGRNPQTGEKMKIAASRVPAFSAGNALKEAV
jgi:DNA-binding protein HU-beta